MITKEALLNKYNISERQFASAGMEWEDLCEIYRDFSENKYPKYRAIADEFVNNYIKEKGRDVLWMKKEVQNVLI